MVLEIHHARTGEKVGITIIDKKICLKLVIGFKTFSTLIWTSYLVTSSMSFIFFTAAEGLELDERYLRLEITDVEGYMIPKMFAPFLKTYIHECVEQRLKTSLTMFVGVSHWLILQAKGLFIWS